MVFVAYSISEKKGIVKFPILVKPTVDRETFLKSPLAIQTIESSPSFIPKQNPVSWITMIANSFLFPPFPSRTMSNTLRRTFQARLFPRHRTTIMISAILAWTGFLRAEIVTFYGYEDCIRLENASVRVTLCPAAGGRVLEYAFQGRNVLYLPPGDEGWRMTDPAERGPMHAGRFDIGPEHIVPKRPLLWMGKWHGEEIDGRHARLISPEDPHTGVQLVREFVLAANGSRLECKQIIRNRSQDVKEYCHWSRTFAVGGGFCVLPTTMPSRFPNRYVMYQSRGLINFRPQDPAISLIENYLIVGPTPAFPKLGMDSLAGWFAYLAPNNLIFVKSFPAYRNRVYNEVAGLTTSIW